jgi:hypothetical protein
VILRRQLMLGARAQGSLQVRVMMAIRENPKKLLSPKKESVGRDKDREEAAMSNLRSVKSCAMAKGKANWLGHG